MDFERRYDSIEEVLDVAKSAEGKLVKEYDVTNRLETKKNKGGIGQIIEEGLFHMAPNSRAEADFANLNLELKVTGIKTNVKQTSFSAKERLVILLIIWKSISVLLKNHRCGIRIKKFCLCFINGLMV